MIDWLFPAHHHTPSTEEARNAAEREAVRQDALNLVAEIKAFVAELKESGQDHRKGYPVEHALRRRRPQ